MKGMGMVRETPACREELGTSLFTLYSKKKESEAGRTTPENILHVLKNQLERLMCIAKEYTRPDTSTSG